MSKAMKPLPNSVHAFTAFSVSKTRPPVIVHNPPQDEENVSQSKKLTRSTRPVMSPRPPSPQNPTVYDLGGAPGALGVRG
jgi:hypothetical protein